MKCFVAYALLVVSGGLASVGCSAIIDPDQGRLGGEMMTPDGGPGLMLMDSGMRVVDGGPIGDGSMMSADGGPPAECELGPATCEGGVLVSCEAGAVVRTACADVGGFCDGSSAPATCRPRRCVPGATRCDGDGEVLLTCNAAGSVETPEDCPSGCVGSPPRAVCVGVTTMCSGVEMLTPGTRRFSTCGEGDDDTHASMTGCTSTSRANGEDVVFALTLERTQRVSLDLRDDDGRASIDTIVYLRTTCDDSGTQRACGDDVPCSISDVLAGCMGGVQVRQSTLTVTLPAGTYYVVADTFNYAADGSTFTCGDVSLTLSLSGP